MGCLDPGSVKLHMSSSGLIIAAQLGSPSARDLTSEPQRAWVSATTNQLAAISDCMRVLSSPDPHLHEDSRDMHEALAAIMSWSLSMHDMCYLRGLICCNVCVYVTYKYFF